MPLLTPAISACLSYGKAQRFKYIKTRALCWFYHLGPPPGDPKKDTSSQFH